MVSASVGASCERSTMRARGPGRARLPGRLRGVGAGRQEDQEQPAGVGAREREDCRARGRRLLISVRFDDGLQPWG